MSRESPKTGKDTPGHGDREQKPRGRKSAHGPIDPLEVALHLEQASEKIISTVPADLTGLDAADWTDEVEFRAALDGLQLVRRAIGSEQHSRESRSQISSETVMSGASVDTQNGIGRAETGAAAFHENPASPEQTRRIGRFEIVHELGRGGFGVVFLARDPELDRQVAIKVPRIDALLDTDARERFDREARLGSLLAHPNIVPIHESHFDGLIVYIVFAWCPGDTLGEWFAKQDRLIRPQLAARMVAQLAQAVHYAHQRGVIHRDLKPANVLVGQDDSDAADEATIAASLRITDFGLARASGEAGRELTRSGAIIGTPAYMSPEQALGAGDDVGALSDVYSLGAILYELLTGQPPLRKETDLATLRAVERDPPLPPRRLRRDVPVDLEAICLKCLEKSPAGRYASAFELQSDLEHFLEGRPVRARRINRLEEGWRWCRRNPYLAVAMALVLVGLLATTWQWRRAETNAYRAQAFLEQSQLQRERAERNLTRAETAIEQMLNEVATVLKHVPRLEAVRSRLLNQALQLQQQLAAEESDDPRILFRAAQSHRRMAEIWRQLGQLEAGLKDAELAAAATLRVGSAVPEAEGLAERARIAHVLATIYREKGNHTACLGAARESAGYWQQVPAIDTDPEQLSEMVRAWRLIGMAHDSLGDHDSAAGEWNSAIALLDAFQFNDPGQWLAIERGQLLNSLGVCYGKLHRDADSEAFYRQSLEVLQPIATAMPERIDLGYNVAVTAFNLGNRHHRRREYPESVCYYSMARELIDALVKSFPEKAGYRQLAIQVAAGLGSALNRTGETEDAARVLESALAIERLLPEDLRAGLEQGEIRASLLVNLGSVYADGLRDHAGARRTFEEARDLYAALVETSPRNVETLRGVSKTEGNLASLLVAKDAWDEAERYFLRALENGEAACDLNSADPQSQSNVAWQVEQLCRISLRRGSTDELLGRIDDYLDRADRVSGRYLQAAMILSKCVSQFDELAEMSTSSHRSRNAGADTFAMTSDDRDRLIVAAIGHLEIAVENGLINLSDGALAEIFRPLHGQPRFAELFGN